MRVADVEDRPRASGAHAPSLPYKPDHPRSSRVTVRGFRLLIALTLLNTTLLGMSVMGPQLFPFLREQWSRWRAEREVKAATKIARETVLGSWQKTLAYAAPSRAVYTEDPVEATRLIREGGAAYLAPAVGDGSAPRGWVPPARAEMPDCLLQLSDRMPLPGEQVLFLHERTAPTAGKCVVVALFGAQSQFTEQYHDERTVTYTQQKTRRMTVSAWRLRDDGSVPAVEKLCERNYAIALPDAGPRVVASRPADPAGKLERPRVDYGTILRWDPGEADAADPSHFTLRYRLDGRDGVIDGWLKDDRTDLTPRDGEWTFDGVEVLHLHAPPTTQPTIYPP